jgi:hypothetical protein
MSNLPVNVIKNLEFLKLLSRARSRSRRELIFKEANREQMLLLVEICYNILKGYFPLTQRQKLRIVPYINFVRHLSRVRTENSARKLIQKGGGLFSFAPLLIPIITEVLRRI